MLKRHTKTIAAVVAAVAAGVASGSVIVSAHDGTAPEPDDRIIRPSFGSEYHLEGNAKAPSSEDRWAVRSYRSEAGRECFMVGQLEGGRFGRSVHGSFVEAPLDVPGDTCANWAQAPHGVALALHQRGAGFGEAVDRSVVFGAAQSWVASLTLIKDQERRTVSIGEHGTFVSVFDGATDLSEIRVIANYQDGSSRALPMAPR